jgi:Bacterial extracellular solute-binding proteins, family 5 Middle
MQSSAFIGSAKGALLGLIAFVLIFSAFPLPAMAASSSSTQLFSMTLIAPTTNAVRDQYAQIIQNSLQGIGIQTSLVYVSFGVLLTDFFGCPAGCGANGMTGPPTYANGGWDAGFVGFGGGTPLPDFGTQNVWPLLGGAIADYPPIGSNYYFFDNATFNQLSAEYSNTFSASARTPIIQKMVSIVQQERPLDVIYYPSAVYAWSSSLKNYGATNAISTGTANVGYEHWTGSNGVTTLNIAVPSAITAVNPIPTSSQNSYYMGYLAFPVTAAGQELDPRCTCFVNGTVSNIKISSDHLTYTVTERPHTFQDGVQVTSEDYIFGLMAGLRNAVGEVSEGSLQSILGLNAQFTFLNGTTDYVMSGEYSHATMPAGFVANSTFTAVNPTTWTFTLPATYVFADPAITGAGALPMHLYEQYKPSTWSTGVLSGFTGSSGALSTSSYTYSWSPTTKGLGGETFSPAAGTYTAYGPVGDGSYIYQGYDPVSNTGTMVKFNNYWNATGLEALGQFNIQTVHVTYINSYTAAAAALKQGSINFMDSNYQPNADDVSALRAAGSFVSITTDPTSGWQEMGQNLNNPYFGTGLGTPLGQSNPSEAHHAALLVRAALSHLIPRQYIVANLLQGLGVVGQTQVNPSFTFAYPTGSAPDTYDPSLAAQELVAAGYTVQGIQPGSNPLPSPTPVVIGTTGVTVPNLLLGSTYTVSGAFTFKNPLVALQDGGFAITLQECTLANSTAAATAACLNNKPVEGRSAAYNSTWTPVALGATNTGGYFTISYTPTQAGSYLYRVFLTGLPQTLVIGGGYSSPTTVQGVVPPVASYHEGKNATTLAYTTPVAVTVGSLGDVFQALATGINSGFSTLNTNIQSVQSSAATASSVSALQDTVNSINSNVNTLTYVAYAALAVAIILGLIAIVMSRRKPGA